jgi:hypothetical protein
VNGAVFGVVAVLLISAGLAASLAPSVRFAGIGYAAVTLVTALLLVLIGSVLLGILLVLATAAFAAAAYYYVHAQEEDGVLGDGWAPATGWYWQLPLVAVFVLGLVVTVGVAGHWHQGTSGSSLLTVLHWRYPLALIVLVALGAAVLTSFVAIAGTSADERTHSQSRADKELRHERMARRRADRAAAKQRRREQRKDES